MRNQNSGICGSEYAGMTVSEASLLWRDIIPPAMDVLEAVWPDQADAILSAYDDVVLPDSGMVDDENMTTEQREAAEYMWDDIDQALNDVAPAGCFFGPHPGDGALFGFWYIETDYDDDEQAVDSDGLDAYDTVWLGAVWDRPSEFAADVIAEITRMLARGSIPAHMPV